MRRLFYFSNLLFFLAALMPQPVSAILPGCPAGSAGCQTELEDTGSESGAGAVSEDPSDTTGSSGSESSGQDESESGQSSGSGSASGSSTSVGSSGAGSGGSGRSAIPINDVVNLEVIPPVPAAEQCHLILEDFYNFTNDIDYDGLYETQELAASTDIDNADTDYDSFIDGVEVCSGHDPLNVPLVNPVNTALMKQLKGWILLQVERRGEAWYIYPGDNLRYYLRNGPVAYQIMRFLGDGITDENIAKIPVGVEPRFEDVDTDGDGLSDKMEGGLKTDPQTADTDGDGASDGEEVLTQHTNPLGSGRLAVDQTLVSRMKGKILLQVESRGEAWYVNPKDNKRYYMKDGEAAYQIMRFLSLGITNRDLSGLPYGILKGKIK